MEPRKIEKKALSPQQVEEIYGIPTGTLANLRYQKRGPRYFALGGSPGKKRKILYFVEDVESWIRQYPVLTSDSIPEEVGR
ncbi:MAG TPA: hypothetical protein PK036_09385 [Geobacteraceae bacterium]|nr:hypothetical protein [Geobacteraceae bacterium]